MSNAIRWRVTVLQGVLVLVLGIIGGIALWAGSFSHSTVNDQLSAQAITFPTAGNAEIKALPAADAAAMLQYAGQTMTTGPQAETYADHFLKIHLSKMPTYSAASGIAMANPTNAKDQATVATVFKGTTLRSMLLNAYGWWTVGTYAIFAGIGILVAAFIVLVALGFEVWRWRATAPATARVPAAAPAAALGNPAPEYGVSKFSRHDS